MDAPWLCIDVIIKIIFRQVIVVFSWVKIRTEFQYYVSLYLQQSVFVNLSWEIHYLTVYDNYLIRYI